ncbi:MAG: hypothetical protein AB2L09_08340 [Coriobacteriia bacterium]
MAFLAVLAAIYAGVLAAAAKLPSMSAANSDIVAAAVAFDLVVSAPVILYILVVRRFRRSAALVLPIVILGTVMSAWILPAKHYQLIGFVGIAAASAELGLTGWIIWKGVRAVRASRGVDSEEPLERFHRLVYALIRNDRFSSLIASELAALYYAFGSWKTEAHVKPGSVVFSYHRRSAYGAIVGGLGVVMVIEGVGWHILASRWSVSLAWVGTFLTVYAFLWLLGDYRATVLRPVLVEAQGIFVRCGLRFSLFVPFSSLEGVSASKPDFGKQSVSLATVGSEPSCWIILREPMSASGFYGVSRTVRAIGVELDDRQGFVDMVDLSSKRTADAPAF